MKRTAGPPVLEPEQRSFEAVVKPPAIGVVARRRSAGVDRPESRTRTQPGLEKYRTVLACSLDDDTA